MAIKTIYHFTALTGGAATALDSVDGNSLLDLDRAFVIVSSNFYVYELDADSGAAESSPNVISPDTNAGTKRWILITSITSGILAVAGGGTGVSTLTTAYGLLAAGTTATGTVQTLAAGALTEILVGGGAAALPVWTTATGTGAPVRAASPTLTGTPLAPTAAVNTNTTQMATTAYVIAQSQNHAKAQVLDAFYRIITPANARLVLLFDQTGAVSTITDRSTIGGTTAHVVTLRDVNGNAINASTLSPNIVGLAPVLNFNASNNWDTPDSADLSFGDGATDSPFSIIGLVKFNSPLTTQALIGKNSDTADGEYYIDVYNTGVIIFATVDQSTTGNIGRSTPAGSVGATLWHTIIGTKSSGITAAAFKIYVDGIQVDNANYSGGAYTAMENKTALVASYETYSGVKGSLANRQDAFSAIVAEELTALQVRQLDTVLRGWTGNSFN